jgi:hypothetical protein
MRLPTLSRLPLLAGIAAVLAACTAAQMTPVWESWASANDQEDRYESVHSVLADPAGAVIAVGVSSSLQTALDQLVVVKYTLAGQVIWKAVANLGDYDKPYAARLGTDGSIYAVTETAVIKFDRNGFELWRKTLEGGLDGGALRDLELNGNQLLVAGRKLYVLDLNGAPVTTVTPAAPLWDVAVTSTGIYTAGYGHVQRFDSNLQPVWHWAHADAQNPPAELAVAADGTVYVATYNDEPQDSSYLTRISSNGAQVWTKFFNDPDSQSYQVGGVPKVKLLATGNLVLGLSQQPTRILNIINPANGSVLYSTTQKSGIINELETDASGNIYVAGNNTPQKFDSKAALLASGTMNAVDVTSGGLALYGNAIYVGAGAFDSKGKMKLYLSKYNNQ